ncbi:hypothetical protein [Maribrevibacterium harenarium]|uniref:hypothetical protein n=1 Tax=Maribrevibacterium harenarium TaxID=2589817 RepID=UPI002E253D55
MHIFTTNPTNEHDLNQLPELLYGNESFVSADFGCRDVEKRSETKERKVDWLVAEMPSKICAWKFATSRPDDSVCPKLVRLNDGF